MMEKELKQNKWKRYKLRDAAKEVRKLFEPNREIYFPYIGLEHIEQNALKLNGMGDSSDTISTKKIFNEGDILFGSLRPYFRKVVRPKFGGVCSTDITVIRANVGFDTSFLYYFIANKDFIDHATNISSGTRMPRANWNVLCESEWYFPILDIQHKIAAILSAYDDLIENNMRRIKILEEMAQNLYSEWFVNFCFPGHEQTRFVDSPMGHIPEGWEVTTVENAFTIIGGGTPSKKVDKYWNGGDVNWYTPSDLTATKSMFMVESSNKITELGLKKSSAKLFPPYSVMMTSRATLGVVSINTTEACTNQGFITCIPNEKCPLYLLYFWLKEHVENFINHASGATFKEISKGVFKTIEIIVPHREVTIRFEDVLRPMGLQILNLQRKNYALCQTRDLLLPKLISGEVEVSNIDINVSEEEAV